MYFDESIRSIDGFIVAALVVSSRDLSMLLRSAWDQFGYPDHYEYKSCSPKARNPRHRADREFVHSLLLSCDVALLVCPLKDRHRLSNHCLTLVNQLTKQKFLDGVRYSLYVDQGIPPISKSADEVPSHVEVVWNGNSVQHAGIQVADHAAHMRGTILFEELRGDPKIVTVGENEGYLEPTAVELGYELWARTRSVLIGVMEDTADSEETTPEPYRLVDGYGLYVAPSCSTELANAARRSFGRIYLGCIH